MTVPEAQAALEAAVRELVSDWGPPACGEPTTCSCCAMLRALAALDEARKAEAGECPTCGGTRFEVRTDANGYRNSGYCRDCDGTGKAKEVSP